jgi:mannose-6-phosphate isomerase-like protein (cupin superfamily)
VSRITPGQAGAFIAALALGGVLGIVGDRLARDTGPMRATETVNRGEGTLADLPRGPVGVRAESERLPGGFESTRSHGGPTFSIVESGRVEIVDAGKARTYGPGDFFFQPQGHRYTIRILETATLSVVRLLPPGAVATTEVR